MGKRRKAKAPKGTLFGKPRSQVVKRPGAFSAKAKRAGVSTGELAEQVLAPGSKADLTTKKEASLDKAFATMRRRKAAGNRSYSAMRRANTRVSG